MSVTTEDAPVIRLLNVHKSFGKQSVLNGVSLDVHRGEVVCILGPSGSGKSTLLRCINHIEPIDRGRVELSGTILGYRRTRKGLRELPDRTLSRQRAAIGMVFQHFNLFQNMTVLENIMLGPVRVKGLSSNAARTRALELLDRVGLAGYDARYPNALSGGQQQRVAIARALAMEPAVMLFDEPTSALDPELVGEVLDVTMEVARAGMTMLVVTHEIGFARTAADRVIVMDDGLIIEQGTAAEVLDNARNERTRRFLSKVNRCRQAASAPPAAELAGVTPSARSAVAPRGGNGHDGLLGATAPHGRLPVV
jgi:polar amino acid transport system ATP-binding protein